GDRRPAGLGRRCVVPVPLDAAVRAGRPAAVAGQDGLGGAERREHGDDPQDRGRLRRLEAARRRRRNDRNRRVVDVPTCGERGPVDLQIFPHVDSEGLPWNTMANAERWAGGLSGPAYAINDETAIRVVDGTVDVVSEGHWKLLTP